jgi:hypothetical protein
VICEFEIFESGVTLVFVPLGFGKYEATLDFDRRRCLFDFAVHAILEQAYLFIERQLGMHRLTLCPRREFQQKRIT